MADDSRFLFDGNLYGNNRRCLDTFWNLLVKKIIIFLLFIYSLPVLADDYPAIQVYYANGHPQRSSYALACADVGTNGYTYPFFWSSDNRCVTTWDGTTNLVGNVRAVESLQTTFACPGGGSLISGVCYGANACPSGQSRSTETGQCAHTPLDCPLTQYDNGTQCVDIPNCNTDSNELGSYFDTWTQACSSESTTMCVTPTPSNLVYCAPIDDCIDPTVYRCSNAVDPVALAQSERQAKLDLAEQEAEQYKSDADIAADLAVEESLKKSAELTATEERLKEIGDIILNPDATRTQEEIAQAKLDYQHWVEQQALDKIEAKNAWDAAKLAEEKKKAAQDALDKVKSPATTPGVATAEAANMETILAEVRKALVDAITGKGDGTGPGTGEQNGTSTSQIVSAIDKSAATSTVLHTLTKDAVDGVKASVDGVKASVDGVKEAIENQQTDCEKNPDHVSCMEAGEFTATGDGISTAELGLSFGTTTWGSSGSCPADIQTHFLGQSLSISYAPFCTYLSNLAPVLIALSFLLAGYIVLGVKV